MTIGIFDTGLGGEMVTVQLKTYFPTAIFHIANDHAHLPYGDRSPSEIYALTKQAITPLLGCDMLVIACNTATAAAIDQLRIDFPQQQFIGYEPMVKPAANATKTGKVIILATAATVTSKRFRTLVDTYANGVTIITPDTTNWARNIEMGRSNDIDLTEISTAVKNGADVIALACTHYLALEKKLHILFPNTTIIEPTPAVAQRITALASQPQ